MITKRVLTVFSLLMIVSFVLAPMSSAQEEKIKLTILTHWAEERLLTAQQAILDEYTASHPNVTFELITVPFDQLYTKITTMRTAGESPDIYHLYNLWLPEFVTSDMMSTPPASIVDAVVANTSPGVVEGTTFNGQVWGYPTEVNTYLLLYNKRLLQEAGFSEPPKNWDELVNIAKAITKVDETGAVTQVGFAVITGWDSGVVHPFASLLFSNGGSYLSDDYQSVAFGSEAGLQTLQLYQDLLDTHGMDMSMAGMTEFPNGTVGMIIMANWWRATLMASEKINYDTELGVAPIPVGPSGTETSTLSYNWLWGVDKGSPHAEAAWEFIQWLNAPRAEGQASPMGDLLVNQFGAIPSNVFDQVAYADAFSDHFLAPFVASTAYARPEPLVGGSQEIKTLLQTEIESMWSGMTDPQSVLDYVVPEANAILEEFRAQNE
jgi:multiple sugar transport system substrate-binding protein